MTDDTQAPGTPPIEQIRSPLAKPAQPKAPARVTTKKRLAGGASAGTSATSAATTAAGVKPRVTRRELKKLTEMDLEEKDAGAPAIGATLPPLPPPPPAAAVSTAPPVPVATVRPFGEGAANAAITPSSLHDDFVNLMKAQGLEKMATEAGLMKDGALVDIKQEVVERGEDSSSAAGADLTGASKRQLSETSQDGGGASSPTFGSPYVSCAGVWLVVCVRLAKYVLYAGIVEERLGKSAST